MSEVRTPRRGWRLRWRTSLVILAASIAAGVWARASRGPAEPPVVPDRTGVIAAEFDHQHALMLAWDSQGRASMKDSWRAIIAAASRRAEVWLMVEPAEDQEAVRRELAESGADASRLKFLAEGIGSPWIRDTGPLSYIDARGGVGFLDFLLADGDHESQLAAKICRALVRPRTHCDIVLQRGNLLSNGAGLLLATSRLHQWNAENGLSEEEVLERLTQKTGGAQLIVVPEMDGEPCGHVDMFATFVAPDVLLLGEADADYDPYNAAVLNTIAENLRGLPTPLGPLRIERIPLPRRRRNPHADIKGGVYGMDMWLTYTNVAYLNGAVLMPSYSNPTPPEEAVAEETYRRLLPDWEVIKIPADGLIQFGGSVHCATLNVVAGDGAE